MLLQRIDNIKQSYFKKMGRQEEIKERKERKEIEKRLLDRELVRVEKATTIITKVAKETQSLLEYRISNLVSLALEAVFDDPYNFVVRFVEKRGKTECELLFEQYGETVKPVDASGFGVVDIACFALRISCWALTKNKAPVFLLDEPFKHLKTAEANKRAIQMVKEVAQELQLQIIMVSDERAARSDIKDGADKVFEFRKTNNNVVVSTDL